MAYAYQQNVWDGASYGYVKYNISPDLGTVVSAGTTITITGQAYFKNRANKSIEVSTEAGNTYRSSFVNINIPKATATTFTLRFHMWELSDAWGSTRVVTAPINFTLWSGTNCDGNGDGTMNYDVHAISYLTYRYIRLCQVEKIIYDKDEDVVDKLVSVYGALAQFVNHVVLFIVGKKAGVKLYLGVRSKRHISVAEGILAFIANREKTAELWDWFAYRERVYDYELRQQSYAVPEILDAD